MRLLRFDVAGSPCALPIEQTREIVDSPEVTRVPGASAAIRGVAAHRGRVLTVIDVAARLGLARSPARRPIVVVAQVDDAAEPLGLQVDRVDGIAEVPPERITRSLPGPIAGIEEVAGIVRDDGALVLILDLGRLVDRERLLRCRAQRHRASAGELEGAAMQTRAAVIPTSVAPSPRPSAHPERSADAEAPARSRWAPTATATATATPTPTATPTAPTAVHPERSADAEASARSRRVPTPTAIPISAHPERSAAAGGAESKVTTSRSRAIAAMISTLTAGIVVLALHAAVRPGPRPAPVPPPASFPLATVEHAAIPAVTPSQPAPPPRPLHPASLPARVHEVVPGETLWSISRHALGNPFAWRAVYSANRANVADPDRIEPGQRLTIPEPPGAPAAEDPLERGGRRSPAPR